MNIKYIENKQNLILEINNQKKMLSNRKAFFYNFIQSKSVITFALLHSHLSHFYYC
jgi:hypothetical protein